MQDWNLWLGSNETRTAIKIIKEYAEDIVDSITDGSHLQEKSMEKVALDYTYSSGKLDGIREVLQMIKDIKEIVEEEKDSE